MIRKPFVPLVGSMRWGTIIRIGYYCALAALILLNGIVFLPRLGRAPSQRPSEVAYDLPRIGAALPATSIPTTDGGLPVGPVGEKRLVMVSIYWSNSARRAFQKHPRRSYEDLGQHVWSETRGAVAGDTTNA